MEDLGEPRYGLRKRRRIEEEQSPSEALEYLLGRLSPDSHILVFSGSGLSASSGMSTFSTKGGLYEKAQHKFGIADGKRLFTYSFYEKNRQEAQQFLTEVYLEALEATPAPGHHAIAALNRAGRLQRHYTLNIDGLAAKAGMSTWHPEYHPDGVTVELHGNVHHLVCVECGGSMEFTQEAALEFRRTRQPLPCNVCPEDLSSTLRPKVMLYEDADSEVITPDDVLDLMEDDAKAADVILWVGISFQQSASTSYFRRVRRALQEAGRIDRVIQALINPSEDTLWNLLTACSNQQELNVLEIRLKADDVLPRIAGYMRSIDGSMGGRSGASALNISGRICPINEKENADDDKDELAALIGPETSPTLKVLTDSLIGAERCLETLATRSQRSSKGTVVTRESSAVSSGDEDAAEIFQLRSVTSPPQ